MRTTREPNRYLVPAAIALVAAFAIGVPAACQRIEEPSVSPDPRTKPSVLADGPASAQPSSPAVVAAATKPVPAPVPAPASAPTPGVCPPDPDPIVGRSLFVHGAATFVTPDGKRHAMRAEIARTPEAQERGMMFRTSMGQDDAMVFEFAQAHQARFWMHNTCIALDMVFVGEDARVIGVVTAPPLDDDARFVNGYSKWVVELPAGTAQKLGIAMGTVFEAPKP